MCLHRFVQAVHIWAVVNLHAVDTHLNNVTPIKSFDVLTIRGCFGEVWGRFRGYFWEMCWEVFGTFLGGFIGADFRRFLDSFREGC